jgi:hypothetical protein
MANDVLKKTIIATLNNPITQAISFQCGSRIVDSSLFKSVADMLTQQGSRRLVVDPRRLGANMAAGWDRKNSVFLFSNALFGTTVAEQAILVHESVHAGFHIQGNGQNYQRIDNEPCAYLAESFFLMSQGVTFKKLDDNLAIRLAFTIASTMRSKKLFWVPVDDLQLLRNGILRSYIHDFPGEDGAPSPYETVRNDTDFDLQGVK